MNTPKVHNNVKVRAFLDGYVSVQDLCEDYPPIDDIFSGVLELKTEGVTSTRSLSRQVLFHILQQCRTIDVSSVKAASRLPYAYRTLAAYASLARVASKAIESFSETLPDGKAVLSTGRACSAIDVLYADGLAFAAAACRTWTPESKSATYREGEIGGPTGLALLRNYALARLVELG